jgi:hypothetical protein
MIYCKIDSHKLEYIFQTDEYYCPFCGLIYENPYSFNYHYNENSMNLLTQNDLMEFNYLHQDFNKIVGNHISEKNLSTSINLMIETRNKLLYFIYDNKLNSYKSEIMEYFNNYYKIIKTTGNNSFKFIDSILIKTMIMYYSTHNLNLNLYEIVKKYIENNFKDWNSKAKYKNMLDFARFIKENNDRIISV